MKLELLRAGQATEYYKSSVSQHPVRGYTPNSRFAQPRSHCGRLRSDQWEYFQIVRDRQWVCLTANPIKEVQGQASFQAAAPMAKRFTLA